MVSEKHHAFFEELFNLVLNDHASQDDFDCRFFLFRHLGDGFKQRQQLGVGDCRGETDLVVVE